MIINTDGRSNMMLKLLIRLLICVICLLFVGCTIKKPVVKVSTKTRTKVKVKQASHDQLLWKCTVDGNHHQWSREGVSLFIAQMKAKRLCTMFSKGHDVCHYKGCVQVR